MRSCWFNAWHTCLARAIKGYSGLEKFRSQQVTLEMQGKKIQFRPQNRNLEKFINISECTKTRNLLKTQMLRYLWKVQRTCISGEFLAERSPYILCCDWNFFPRVNPLQTTQTNMASNWLLCISRVSKHERTPSLAALWLGKKKTKVFWHQSEARAAPTVWKWSVKTLSPAALFHSFLTFLRPNFFSPV